ncbi:biotin/lipoyl-binding protein [Nitrosomonas sp. HPC101]|uniref:efflux RND transporter periplasmic adaptor subunit n=1 Tax=Nitrosomonas sp. HPC101 TaxID=1658667 RepID=UPI001370FDC7|nr:HlyD family efflux transporter periplasmic adaptor subunit [Nitrosomonas sp. HPC101]MXS85913.1 biotin/lipoyl-binding protein [Nitrosomonas sp. HPC101]
MQIRHTLPILAISGFLFASYTIVSSNQPLPIAPVAAEPAASPYKSFIAGAGIVEAKSRNISIGTALSGLVTRVAVEVGDQVEAGTPLFYLDDREARAELAVKKADLARVRAGLIEARAMLRDSKSLSDLVESLADQRAVSSEEVLRRHNTLRISKTRLNSAETAIQQAEAQLASTQTTLDLLIVRAPVSGQILQVNIRPGEFAQAGFLTTPLMLMGNLDQLHVRVDIDENDAWRFDRHSRAVAYLRGNRDFSVELTPAYVEPYVIPKQSLTGDSTEQVDTRVLQALYSFDRKQLPVYVGQQMDVFIEVRNQPDNSDDAAI